MPILSRGTKTLLTIYRVALKAWAAPLHRRKELPLFIVGKNLDIQLWEFTSKNAVYLNSMLNKPRNNTR